jgi:cytochrome c oxidase assembly protein subunit 11
MFGFGFALVPLYDVICDITGLNGRTADGPAASADYPVDESRAVTVEFVALENGYSAWEFRPAVTRMSVVPGKLYQTTFFARNLQAEPKVAQAVPSVAPGRAARHFNKTECFCFTRQVFEPGEGRDMPLVFVLDPKLPPDVATVTLSYTFFELQESPPVAAGNGIRNRGGEGV